MNEIVIRSERGNPITTSRLVAKKFEKEHKNVLRAIDNLECSNEFRQRNFAPLITNKLQHSPVVSPEREYVMTRNGFTFLVMGFTGKDAAKFKEDYIEAFDRMEKALKSPAVQLPNFSDPVAAARAWADTQEQKQLAEAKVKEMEPKALFADAVNASEGSILIRDLAKIIKQNGIDMGEKRLYRWLRENKYLCRDNNPTQKSMELGLFEIVEGVQINWKDNSIFPIFTTKVTGKGQLYFVNKFLRQPNKAA